METNEIMNNEEVIEVTEGIATASSGKGLKIAVGIGLTVLASGLAYRYIIKPMVVKIKAKKEEQKIYAVNADQFNNDEEEPEEN